jgi:hypothetical protein
MDDCSEGNHMGNMKMDCGYIFRCPLNSKFQMTKKILFEISKLGDYCFPHPRSASGPVARGACLKFAAWGLVLKQMEANIR